MESKVRFDLKNVHYAKLTEGATPPWGTPVKVPGAVSLELDSEGEETKFYADGIVYYHTTSNNGYSGSLEMARFPDAMLKDIWGMTLGATSKVLTENANTEPASFALLYQINGDADNEYYVLYNVSGTRPGIGSQTIDGTKDPQTQSIDLTAIPFPSGMVLARTTAETPASVKEAWFNSVFVEGATEQAEVEDTTEPTETETNN